MKKILTVILGILLFIFPMTACKEKEETFNPDVPLLEAYDYVSICKGMHPDPNGTGYKSHGTLFGNQIATDYETLDEILKDQEDLRAKDFCNKKLFEDNIVLLIPIDSGSPREIAVYENFAFDGETVTIKVTQYVDGTYVVDHNYDLVVVPKPETDISSDEEYVWNIQKDKEYVWNIQKNESFAPYN